MQMRTEIVPNSEIITRTRILAGPNRLDMAKAAEIPHASVIRADRAQSVSAETADGISKALGMDFDELFTIKTTGTDGAGAAQDSGQAR